MANTVQLRIFLAGRVAIEADGVGLDEGRFAGRQGRLVFAYLVAARGRPVPRNELAEALWDRRRRDLGQGVDRDREQAARRAHGRRRRRRERADQRVRLLQTRPARKASWVDVTAAADAAEAAEQALVAGRSRSGQGRCRDGCDRCCGQPFLPGEDGAWVEREAARARRRPGPRAERAAPRRACGSATRRGAAKWAEQAIALEPFREGWVSAVDGGARGRGQPRRGAPGVRRVPATARGGARRVPVSPRPRRSTVDCWRRRRRQDGSPPRPAPPFREDRGPLRPPPRRPERGVGRSLVAAHRRRNRRGHGSRGGPRCTRGGSGMLPPAARR